MSIIVSLTCDCSAKLSSSYGMDLAKTVVNPTRQVTKRSTIRGFKDDYYDVDADVVVLAGETHSGRKAVSNSSHSRMTDA